MNKVTTDGILLKPATQADSKVIRQFIHRENLNPMSLHWQRFILAIDQQDNVIGCGQIKHHSDGSHELASIVVLSEWRGRGIARKIIEHLQEAHNGRLYLTCRSQLGPMYEKFGFHIVQETEMTPYFKRLSRIAALVSKLVRLPDHMLVMRKD